MKTQTPGPWEATVAGRFGATYVRRRKGRDWLVIATIHRRGQEKAQNAALIAKAPAMDLLLRLLQRGAAQFDPATGELRFDGIRYGARDGEWSLVVDSMGWAHAQERA